MTQWISQTLLFIAVSPATLILIRSRHLTNSSSILERVWRSGQEFHLLCIHGCIFAVVPFVLCLFLHILIFECLITVYLSSHWLVKRISTVSLKLGNTWWDKGLDCVKSQEEKLEHADTQGGKFSLVPVWSYESSWAYIFLFMTKAGQPTNNKLWIPR